MLRPWRAQTRMLQRACSNPLNPAAYTDLARKVAAVCEVFESVTRRYGKPAWGLRQTSVVGQPVPIQEEIVKSTAFCDLLHFDRDEKVVGKRYDPKVLVVAPMSGHYATLLRGTVEAMIREHNLYVTDWRDAREIPALVGGFDLDDFIDHIIDFIRWIGTNTHVIAVCQPSVPVLAAAARMAAMDDPCRPASITLMGGPIDTRRNPTQVNELAQSREHRVVRAERDRARALAEPGLPAPGLSRLHPAHRLHADEPRAPCRGAQDAVCQPGQGRLRFGPAAPHLLRGIPGRHGPAGRVLPADRRDRVPAPRAARRRHDPPRRAGRLRRHPRHRR